MDILYLGDLVSMTRAELATCLGPYRYLMPRIEELLAGLGLNVGGAAPWWRRPRDYYDGCY